MANKKNKKKAPQPAPANNAAANSKVEVVGVVIALLDAGFGEALALFSGLRG